MKISFSFEINSIESPEIQFSFILKKIGKSFATSLGSITRPGSLGIISASACGGSTPFWFYRVKVILFELNFRIITISLPWLQNLYLTPFDKLHWGHLMHLKELHFGIKIQEKELSDWHIHSE